MKNYLLWESNQSNLARVKRHEIGRGTMTDVIFAAEEACIDREIERGVAKIIAGDVDEKARREYNAALMKRSRLVFQMGLSTSRPRQVSRKLAAV